MGVVEILYTVRFLLCLFPGVHTRITNPIEIERVVRNFKVHRFAGGILYLLNSRVAKLDNAPALGTDEMVVLATLICFLKNGYILTKLMLNNQITLEQQFDCIV
jgi:hypothetical protein